MMNKFTETIDFYNKKTNLRRPLIFIIKKQLMSDLSVIEENDQRQQTQKKQPKTRTDDETVLQIYKNNEINKYPNVTYTNISCVSNKLYGYRLDIIDIPLFITSINFSNDKIVIEKDKIIIEQDEKLFKINTHNKHLLTSKQA